MGDHQRGDADLTLDAADLELHLFAQIGVEVGQRFIEQQHRWLDHQSPSQSYTLALAAGQLPWVALCVLVQANQFQNPLNPLLDLGIRHLAHAQAEGDVVLDGHVREQRVTLEHHTQATAGGLGMGDVTTVQDDTPAGDFNEPGDHLQGGGFTASGRTEQGNEFAFLHREVGGDHGVDFTVAFAEFFKLQKSHDCAST
ncbi:hypothetical protein D3C73_710330 [compost metagenome]